MTVGGIKGTFVRGPLRKNQRMNGQHVKNTEREGGVALESSVRRSWPSATRHGCEHRIGFETDGHLRARKSTHERQSTNKRTRPSTQERGHMYLHDCMAESHRIAVEHGWWDNERNFGELVALLHSEASEIFEQHRDGRQPTEIWYGQGGKPEGIPIECADLLIRLCDMCQHLGIDLVSAYREKTAYNRTRPHRHGGKVA